MEKKTILILYDKDKKNNSVKLRFGYEDFYEYAKGKGITFCRTPISSFDEKKKLFKKAQFFDGKRWSWKNNIRPDIVYDKSPFYLEKRLMLKRKMISLAYVFYNSLELSELLSNKWLTYESFKNFSPKALLVSNRNDLEKIRNLQSEKVILKPVTGSGGKGVEILRKGAFVRRKYPFFAQELIEIKKGIPAFADGAHDLRVIVINEKPFYSFLRIPKKNSLISNLSKGGRIKVVPLEKLPSSVIPFVARIQNKMKKYGKKLYSIDLIIDDDQQPWIIEMNSRPGIILEKEEMPYREYFYDNIINFFKQSA